MAGMRVGGKRSCRVAEVPEGGWRAWRSEINREGRVRLASGYIKYATMVREPSLSSSVEQAQGKAPLRRKGCVAAAGVAEVK